MNHSNSTLAERPDTALANDSFPDRDNRRRQGKALRKTCSRASHAGIRISKTGRDPLALIEDSNVDRLQELLPIRFTRMAESPFAFFRGTAVLQAFDLVNTPKTGIIVQCCGDCHVMNFGGFATPERLLVFDINDFDETLPGPFEWDLKRLATSLVLASRWRGFDKVNAERAALTVVAAYRDSIEQFAEMNDLEAWYAKITIDDSIEEADDPMVARIVKKGAARVMENTSEHIFHKITTLTNGRPRITDQPPLLFHGDSSQASDAVMQQFFEDYHATLSADRQVLFGRYRLEDVAYKVVGVGSVGTRCYVALLVDRQGDHLFLQVKEARPSVLEGRAGPSPFKNNGERVITGQRLMQSASDIFLGWLCGPGDRHFYVRQLRDMKISANLPDYSARLLAAHGHVCARALARAHAKSSDAAMIAGYIGSGDAFVDAIAEYAVAYADQVEKDFESFQKAIRAGRFPIETTSTETEQAIR